MASPPKQLRSIATEQKMLDAADNLLRGGDPRDMTVENVTKLAGAKVSSFYARFGNIEGLFQALHQRYLDSVYQSEYLSKLDQSFTKPDLESSLHFAIKTTLQFAHEKRHAISYFLRLPSTEAAQMQIVAKEILHQILKTHSKEVAREDLRRATENSSQIIYAMWIAVALEQTSNFAGRKTSLSSVIDTTTEMVYLYLTNE
jgi:AcrR family transcriptional regulator